MGPDGVVVVPPRVDDPPSVGKVNRKWLRGMIPPL